MIDVHTTTARSGDLGIKSQGWLPNLKNSSACAKIGHEYYESCLFTDHAYPPHVIIINAGTAARAPAKCHTKDIMRGVDT